MTDKDMQFVPIELEFRGRKGNGFLYKPQQIIVTEYITLEAFERFGGKYKERSRQALTEISSVVPTQQWNTNPPTGDTYDILLSVKTGDDEPCVWIGCYEGGHYYYADGIIDVDDEIVAWMPLPQPYSEMEEE